MKMKSDKISFLNKFRFLFIVIAATVMTVGSQGWVQAQEVGPAEGAQGSDQAHFGSPEELVNHLVIAIARADKEALQVLFGESWHDLVPSDGVGPEIADKFLSAWAMSNTLIPEDQSTRTLAVGDHGWTFPVPIVLMDEGWAFDTDTGIEEVRTRQIGRNELAVMQALLAYRDAQFEYSAMDHDGDGVIEYAQKVRSSPGAKDGLYWETEEDSDDLSPLGPLFAEREPTDEPYLGYRYKILTSQGQAAPGGARDYVADGNMTGGFALVAWPAEYGVTGVMSFLINQEGTVYESDLGPGGAEVAGEIESFNPDARWESVSSGFIAVDSF